MCCSNVELDFSNKKNIVLEGDNGNGKSALLDSIAVCFSEYRRADKYSEYVQFKHDFAKIHLEALINDEPIIFDVTLYVKGGTPFTRIVTYKNKTYQNTEVSKLLKELDLPFYSQIIFSMQGQDDITTMTPAVRASYLQRLLQFNFDSALETIKNTLSEIETNKMYNKNKIEFAEKEIKNKCFEEKKELPYDTDTFNSKKEKLVEYENQLKEKDSIYQNITDIQKQMNDIALKGTEISNKDKNNKNSELLLNQYNAEIDSEIEKLNSLQKPEKKDFNSILELKEKIKSINSELSDIDKKIWNTTSDIKILKEREKLHKNGKCPCCGQSTDFIQHENIEEQINKKLIELKKFEAEKAELSLINDNTEKEIKQLETEKNNYDKNINKYNSDMIIIKSKIDNLKNLASSIKFEDFVDNRKELLKQKQDLIYQEQQLHFRLESLSKIENEKITLEKEIDLFTSIMIKNEWIDSNNYKIQNEISNLKSQIESLNGLLATQEKQYEYYKEAKKLLDNDLPNYLIVKTCSRLESEINDFIKIVFPTMNVSLFQNKKGVEFYYSKDSTDKVMTAKMASGFEKSLLSIAFKVALCKAYNLSLSILDEIDAFASDSNSEKIYSTLIDNNIFNQLFIITHKPSTRELIKDCFDDVTFFHVEKGKFIEI